MIRPVFTNSAHVAAPEALMLRGGRWQRLPLQVRYGLIRHPLGPMLIDTGYTCHATALPGRSTALRLYNRLLRPRLIAENQPGPFLARHGLRPEDISRVIVTHFHADHVSGLALLPQARIIASGAAFRRLQARSAWANLRHGTFAELLPADTSARLDAIEDCPPAAPPLPGHDLFGDGTVIAVDLPGHADGHFGLFFPGDPPLFYGTDAQWLMAALQPGRRPGPPASLFAEDRAALGPSSDLLHRLRAAGATLMLCHDPAPASFDEGAAP